MGVGSLSTRHRLHARSSALRSVSPRSCGRCSMQCVFNGPNTWSSTTFAIRRVHCRVSSAGIARLGPGVATKRAVPTLAANPGSATFHSSRIGAGSSGSWASSELGSCSHAGVRSRGAKVAQDAHSTPIGTEPFGSTSRSRQAFERPVEHAPPMSRRASTRRSWVAAGSPEREKSKRSRTHTSQLALVAIHCHSQSTNASVS